MRKYFIPFTFSIISLILFSYVFYKSEIFANGLKHEFYYKYYILSLIMIIFSIISFFIKRDLNAKIFMVFFSSILIIYIVEFSFYYKFKIAIEESYRAEFFNEFKKKNPKKVPPVYPLNFIRNTDTSIFPLSGISKKETILCNEGYLVTYMSDRYGYNNPDPLWEKEDVEILLIGDSFVHGACVFDKDSLRGQLEKLTNGKSVINLGMGGAGTLTQYAILKEYFLKLKPKKVIWVYYEENDIGDLLNEKNSIYLNKYLSDDTYTQNLHLKQSLVDKKLITFFQKELKKNINKDFTEIKFLINVLKSSIKLSEIRRFISRSFLYINPTYDVPKDFKKILIKTKKYLNENNSELYFVYMPEKKRYRKKLSALESNKMNNYLKIINIVNDLKIPVIDLNMKVFKEIKKPSSLFPKNGVHLNKKGYEKTSEFIFKYIYNLN